QQAVQRSTSTIPIVMLPASTDPVAAGLVASLARPGRNVTGVSAAPREAEIKRLEVLGQAVPGLKRVAIFGWWPATAEMEPTWRATAERVGVSLELTEVLAPP